MANFIGLNVAFRLSDINDSEESLENIGLDIRDLDIIRGIQAENINSNELKLLSGLDLDQKKELYSISRASGRITNSLDEINDIQVPLLHNIAVDDQIRASSIKYKFLDYSANNEIKTGDISTSRVSSWSILDPSQGADADIFYGGEVEVIGNEIQLTDLKTRTAPVEKRYAAETPTHLITVDINGTPKQFYAMKGIPIQFEAFFRNANLSHEVSQLGSITPVWRIENTSDDLEYENTTLGIDSTYAFRDNSSKPRIVEFYYNPANILKLELPLINISDFPNTVLSEILELNLEQNDFYQMPVFNSITPKLQILNMSGNNLSRARDASGDQIVANTQLSFLPTTLKSLSINGCFVDNTTIDISYLTSLEVFNMNQFYDRYNRRTMSDTGSTPKVNSSTIKTYNVRNRYTKLDTSVTTSTSLENLNLVTSLGNISKDSSDNDIIITSTVLRSFRSRRNSHQIVDVNAKNLLTRYEHSFSRNLVGSTTISGKFSGCANLQRISLYATSATGTVGTNFQNLTNLRVLDLRWSNLDGSLQENSFSGCDNLQTILFAGSNFNTENFFDNSANTGFSDSEIFYTTPNLRNLYVYVNKNIAGNLPDFSTNEQLRTLYITRCNFGGNIPLFSENTFLFNLQLWDNNFTGSVPAFAGSNFRNIYLYKNNLSGVMPALSCSRLLRLYLGYNQLSGPIPTFENCPALRNLRLQNNILTDYTTGSITECLSLREIDLSNNSLTLSAAKKLISDLVINYTNNQRTGVSINLAGNNLSDIENDPEAGPNLTFLRQSARWSIII